MHPIAEKLQQVFPDDLLGSKEAFGELTVVVKPDRIVEMLTFLRDDPETAFNQLSDVTAVDYRERQPRFDVVYHLNALDHHRRMRVTVGIPEEPAEIESVYSVYRLAGFGEREVFDLFGIRFRHHPDLRRIFLPDDYDGHPLRKDYPTEGKGWRADMDFIPIGPIPGSGGT